MFSLLSVDASEHQCLLARLNDTVEVHSKRDSESEDSILQAAKPSKTNLGAASNARGHRLLLPPLLMIVDGIRRGRTVSKSESARAPGISFRKDKARPRLVCCLKPSPRPAFVGCEGTHGFTPVKVGMYVGHILRK